MQPHPHAEMRECFAQAQHVALHWLAVPETGAVLQIDTVGAGVLRNHQQLLHAGIHETFGFGHDVFHRAADEISAQARNDAERAAMVAAFGNFQVGIVARGELDTLRWHQVNQGVVAVDYGLRNHLMDGRNHFFVGMRAGDAKHAGMHAGDLLGVFAHAAGDNDAAVFTHGLADGVERFLLGAVDETAGVDDDHIGAFIAGDDVVAFQFQLGEDAFGVDQGFGAAE